jgi:hypothetical protein
MSDISDALGGTFNPTEHEPSKSFEVLPTGWYTLLIEDAAVKDTKAKNGKYLELTMQVTEGEFKGRKVWKRITLVNPSAKAVEIGVRDLAGLGQACGMTAIEDSAELKDRVIQARIVIRKDKDDKDAEPENDVQAFRSSDGKSQAASSGDSTPPPTVEKSQPPATAKPKPPAAAGKRPWERK